MAGGSHGSEAVIAPLLTNLGSALAKFAGPVVTGSSCVLAEPALPVVDSDRGLRLVGGRRARRGGAWVAAEVQPADVISPADAAAIDAEQRLRTELPMARVAHLEPWPAPRAGDGVTADVLVTARLKPQALPVEKGTVTTPRVPRPSLAALVTAAVAWVRSPASLPWRGDLVRAALAPVVVGAAAVAPLRTVPLTAAMLVAGAYLLLVLAAALGRLEDGVRVPAGLLLGLDALHLFWATHLTGSLGGPVPVVAATAGVCLLLRLALLPPVPATAAASVLDLRERPSTPRPAARRCPGCPHTRSHGTQRHGRELARAQA